MAFLRYEEFYESPHYQRQMFTLAEFMSWYSANKGDGMFTYTDDWGGFNMPANIIAEVHRRGIPDPNHYDALMLSIYELISIECKDSYIIGVSSYDTDSYKAHELTHAMYYIDAEYQIGVLNILNKYRSNGFLESLKQALRDEHYVASVMEDEISAYVATGEMGIFKKIKNKRRMTQLRKDIKALHAKHYNKFLPVA